MLATSDARTVVTGCAGFLGSHLCEELLARGHTVTGVDCFTDYYSARIKHANLARFRNDDRFQLIHADLAAAPLAPLLANAETVFHLAAQPGVRDSFGSGMAKYLRHNVRATERLLEATAQAGVEAFVYASSSSVYGDQQSYPVSESACLQPLSPYGSTKVMTEQLARIFWQSRGVPVVGLRYFTVYGPRQRPDMAFSRFLAHAIRKRPIPLLGDGKQVREFTFVGDAIDATIAAAQHGQRGSVYNIGGGQPATVLETIELLETLLERPLEVERSHSAVGDPRRTEADISRATHDLGYRPTTSLPEGLELQLASMSERLTVEAAA